MKSWSVARWLANNIPMRSTEPADWLENTGFGIKWIYEHSEQARAPHTNGPRDVPRCGALSLLQKTLHHKGGCWCSLPLFAAALVVRRRYFIVAPRPFPAAPLVARCMYMAVVPGPMPAAVASRCCRRRSQELVAPAARSAKTDACGRSFAVVSTQVSTVGLRLG